MNSFFRFYYVHWIGLTDRTKTYECGI